MKELKNFHPRSIIVQMPNWLGDVVMATPVLSDLKQAFPRAELTALCQKNIAPLLAHDSNIDQLFQFERSRGMMRRRGERNVVARLREGKYDLGILLTNSFSSAWRLWQGRVKKRLGYVSDGRRFLLTHPLSFPANRKRQHLTLTYKQLLSPLGIPQSDRPPHLRIAVGEIDEARAMMRHFPLPSAPKFIGINPGAAFGSAKCWLPERFKEVANNLLRADPDHVVLFFGDSSHEHLIRGICRGLPQRAINLAGKTTLRQLLALLKMCATLLTNDSGPMHIADSLGLPLVALFGSTNPIVTGPYSQRQSVIWKKTPCSPCFQRVCPIDFPCMKEIGVEEVTKAVLLQLQQSKKGAPCLSG